MTLILMLSLAQLAQAQLQQFEYYAADRNEAEFSFTGYVTVNQSKEPTRVQIDPLIRRQMRYMLGLMRSREKTAAALYPKWNFSTLEVKKNTAAGFTVKYLLKSRGIFAAGTTEYTFNLPYNPQTIFADSQGKCMKEKSEDSNFWYHWEPLHPGCPLVENTHYFQVTAKLVPKYNTVQTFPEYAKLVDATKTIKMTMFFGFEHYDFANWNPQGGEDWGIRGYNQQREFLKAQGFSETVWTPAQVESIYKAKDKFVPYVIEMNRPGPVAHLRIRLVLADTGFSHKSTAFHYFLKESLAKESVIVYNGHSGIGHNLDIPAIERLRRIKMPMNPNYQILFLGSCVPYAYFTDMFFAKKRTAADPLGTLNLDIFTYGKESIFGNVEDQALTRALVRFGQDGSRTSYQTIVRTSPKYFFAVNGDDDNPTK